ncbi:MAG: hypothetical protein AAF573_18505, partial [Bacteroidota bacterium]
MPIFFLQGHLRKFILLLIFYLTLQTFGCSDLPSHKHQSSELTPINSDLLIEGKWSNGKINQADLTSVYTLDSIDNFDLPHLDKTL